jgi:predicted ABC-type transport system involved in lysophospholipase L1 biosynthesis ATPase subunit
MVTPALRLRSVTKVHQRGTERVVALDQADLVVALGEVVAVVGPSGSGKSTLLHLAGGLDNPDSGSVEVLGVPVAGLDAGARAEMRRRRVGFVFQSFHLLPALDVLDNVALPLALDKHADARARAEHYLEIVGLTHRLHHRPSELSGGEMQRAAVARAVVMGPELLLADEPTGNLDSVTGRTVLGLILSIARSQGAGLVLVTHDRKVARHADRIVTVTDGRLR